MTNYIRHPQIAELTAPQLEPISLEEFLSKANGIGCKRGWNPRELVPITGQELYSALQNEDFIER